jgi:uncharacterized OB-fold protein
MTTARFWRDNATRYNLMATRCGNCGKVTFPPRHVCPVCHRRSMGKMQRFKLSGVGEVYSFSLVHEAPSAFELQKPYLIAIIKMEEGVMLTAQLIDCDAVDVMIGMKVRATLRKIGEEGPGGIIHYGYKFAPQ